MFGQGHTTSSDIGAITDNHRHGAHAVSFILFPSFHETKLVAAVVSQSIGQ